MMTRRDALALPLASLMPGMLDPRLAFALDDADPTKVFTGGKKPTDVRLGPRTGTPLAWRGADPAPPAGPAPACR